MTLIEARIKLQSLSKQSPIQEQTLYIIHDPTCGDISTRSYYITNDEGLDTFYQGVTIIETSED